ncbi:sensor histidine kinase [Lacticaseibacillus parakribbianus]|uniref:sensor histidine kinase n=1 Tax=Lacticaseibacillus parakribbianus TaxID=2970927 RepID=UPI0021CB7047|nr:sensor histidine kinase [Lacticaseibacillus parakribbianus]
MRDYLQDHVGQLLLFVLGLILFCFGIWLDPGQRVNASTLVYMAALALLAAAFAVWWQARRERRFKRQLEDRAAAGQNALDWPLPAASNRREQAVVTAYNHVLQAHLQDRSALLAAQADQKAFIDSWVHEIKVPLAASTLLVDSLDGQAPEQPLDDMALQLDAIDHYVEQVLYYSRLDSFSKDYLLREYRLRPVLDAAIVAQRNSFIARHISFEAQGDATVVTDSKWLGFILAQIISNALKYTAPGGKLVATIAAGNDAVTLALQDTGIGIPQDELHRVFEKGFTGTNGRNANQKSTGLGLYLAAQLSEKLGHHLTITSTVGTGTTVTLHFPHLAYYGESGSTLTKPQLKH